MDDIFLYLLRFMFIAFGTFIVGMLIAIIIDVFKPRDPNLFRKVWIEIDPDRLLLKERYHKSNDFRIGVRTHVYMYDKERDIIGTVTPQEFGLWHAELWNGTEKEFLNYQDAKDWVENYKPRVYK